MKRLLRWIGIALGGVVVLAIIAFGVAYILSERVLRQTYPAPAVTISIPTDPASLAEGKRLATVRGCVGACHGKEAEGVVMFDDPMIGRVVAPNLPAAAKRYSAAQLAVALRNGLRPDGTSMIVMPSEMLAGLTDEDLGRLIAFLKSMPEVAGPGPSISMGPLGRIGLATGKFKVAAQHIAEAVPPPEAKGDEAIFGRYLARTTCSHCHGSDLRGGSNPEFTSPGLKIVGSYSAEAFDKLMRTGVPPGDRKLNVMGPVARGHFSLFTDAEVAALYSYLHALS